MVTIKVLVEAWQKLLEEFPRLSHYYNAVGDSGTETDEELDEESYKENMKGWIKKHLLPFGALLEALKKELPEMLAIHAWTTEMVRGIGVKRKTLWIEVSTIQKELLGDEKP